MLKKSLAFILSLMMLFSIVSTASVVASAETDLTGSIPIYTASDLMAIKNNLAGKYHLANDIVLSDEWEAIGTSESFSGVFDGNGHTISNLKIKEVYNDITVLGLFGVNEGVIKNLGVVNSTIEYPLVGDSSDITICFGTIAALNHGEINNCYVKNNKYKFDIDVTASIIPFTVKTFVGGISGENFNGKITNCYNQDSTMSVDFNNVADYAECSSHVGGIIATTGVNSTVENCKNYSSISANIVNAKSYIAGVIGYNQASIENCYNLGTVKSDFATNQNNLYDFAGGIVGYASNNSLFKCANKGAVSGGFCVGGITGLNDINSNIERCYNEGVINATMTNVPEAGGITGENLGNITDCYNTANVTATAEKTNAYAGGIAGIMFKGKIKRCYSIGTMSATTPTDAINYIGLIVGAIDIGEVENCYYPEGAKSCTNKTVGTAVKLEDMKKIGTFEGFDYNSVWAVDPTLSYPYPFLKISCDIGHYTKTLFTSASLTNDGTKVEHCGRCGNDVKVTPIIPKILKVSFEKQTVNHTGKKVSTKVVVKDSVGKTLTAGADYTVTLKSDFKALGKHTAVVTFKGNYTGQKTITLNIVPKGAKFSKVTPAKKQIKLKWKKVKDVNGYEIQYSLNKKFKGAKTAKIKKASKVSNTIKKLKSKKTYYVRIRTFKKVKKATHYSLWSSAKKVKVK